MKRFYSIQCFLFLAFSLVIDANLFAQNTKIITVTFNPIFQNEILKQDSIYIINHDSLQVSQCKFYISGIEFKKADKTVYKEKNSFHLINIFDKYSSTFQFNINTANSFDKIQFNLGIDSLTNSKGISTGVLDPTKGMYWAWHSGFINLKLEGKSNLRTTKTQSFQFHLGGFRNGFYNLQTIRLNTKKLSQINVSVDILKFLSSIDLQKENHIMTPSKHAVELAKKAVTMFNIKN